MKRFVSKPYALSVMFLISACRNETYEEWAAQFSGNIVAICINDDELPSVGFLGKVIGRGGEMSPLLREYRNDKGGEEWLGFELHRTNNGKFCGIVEGGSYKNFLLSFKTTILGRHIRNLHVKYKLFGDENNLITPIKIPRNKEGRFSCIIEFPKVEQSEVLVIKATSVISGDTLNSGTTVEVESPSP